MEKILLHSHVLRSISNTDGAPCQQWTTQWGPDDSSSSFVLRKQLNKVELMARILKLYFPRQSSFTRMQHTYLVPAIEEKWDEHLRSFQAELDDKDVLLGRFLVVACL